MKKFLLILVLALPVTASALEKESGGGYEFYNLKVEEVFAEAQADAKALLEGWEDSLWSDEAFVHPIDRAELTRIVSTVRYSPTLEKYVENPRGYKEPLNMHFGTADGVRYIEALRPLFDEVKRRMLSEESLADIRLDLVRSFVHEALHHFAYSDDQALRVSRFVYGREYVKSCDAVLQRYPHYQCLYPTVSRMERLRQMINGWLSGERYSPYRVVFSNADHIDITFDLMVPMAVSLLDFTREEFLRLLACSKTDALKYSLHCHAELDPEDKLVEIEYELLQRQSVRVRVENRSFEAIILVRKL